MTKSEKQKKQRESSIVWTGNEIILFLKVKVEYKMSKTIENIDLGVMSNQILRYFKFLQDWF